MNKKAEKILNTTAKLFIQSGIKKTTMDDIAEQAKVSKVTVYKYFSDKDTLYFEVGKYILHLQISRLKEIIKTEKVLIKKFYEFIAVLSDFIDTDHFWLCSELTNFNDVLSDEYAKYMSCYKEILLYLIDEGINTGLIKKNLDRLLVFYYIDMGIVYYQNNTEYRNIIQSDSAFQKDFMAFHISNIFMDVETVSGVAAYREGS